MGAQFPCPKVLEQELRHSGQNRRRFTVAEGRVLGLPANPLIVIGKWYCAFPLMRLPSGPPCVATPARRHVKPHRFPQNPAIPTCFQVSWTPRVAANLAQFWHSSATVLVRCWSGAGAVS